EGAEILARSGENAAFIYSNLGSVLDLAAIGMVDMGTAAGIATGVMASFAGTGMQFSDAVDILAAASVRTKATVEDIGLSLQYIGPLTAQAGISFKDLTAAIGTLADVNIKGAKAGTAMRRIITNLLAPTAAAREAFTDLKLYIEDFTKNGVVNLQEVFDALNRQGVGIQHI